MITLEKKTLKSPFVLKNIDIRLSIFNTLLNTIIPNKKEAEVMIHSTEATRNSWE